MGDVYRYNAATWVTMKQIKESLAYLKDKDYEASKSLVEKEENLFRYLIRANKEP